MPAIDLAPKIDLAIARLVPATRVVTIDEKGSPRRRWTVGPRGSSLLLESSSPGLRPFRYFYRVTGGQMEAYDLDLKERLVRKLRARDLEGIAASIGVIEDPVRAAAQPAALKKLLDPLRGKRAWTGQNPYRLAFGDAVYRLRFTATGELDAVTLARGGKSLSWTVTPGSPVRVGDPAGYRFVDRFVRRPLLPQGDAKARAALDRALLTWRKLGSATVVGSDGRTMLFSFDRTGERRGRRGWDYRQGVLTVVDGNRGWRGKIASVGVGGKVSRLLGERPDRLTLSRVQGTFPFAEWLDPRGRVSIVGDMGGGKLLEMTGGGLVVGLVIDEKGRTTSVESRPAGGGPTSRITYRYLPPSAPLTAPRYEPLPD